MEVTILGSENFKTISENRKARHEYFIIESMETGIELVGTEVKSIRLGQVNLKDSWCSIDNGELFIKGMHISPYEKGNIFNRDPVRVRKLLMHRKEINRLFGKVKQKGKKLYDKREDAAKKDAKRQIERAVKNSKY